MNYDEADYARPWYVVETKPSGERLATEQLRAQGFRVFFPSYVRQRQVRRRAVKFAHPLFPRYLFVSFENSERWQSINGTYGVRRLMGCVDGEPPRPLPTPLSTSLLQACEGGPLPSLEAACAAIKQGLPLHGAREVSKTMNLIKRDSQVRISSGPLTGLTGSCEWSDEERVGVLLWVFGRSSAAVLPRACIEVLAA